MARTLNIVECRVSDDERADYLAALPARTARAAAVSAHFWVFEHASDRGRFVEFTEAGDAQRLADLLGNDKPADFWREVRGG
jgi:hypothetical protein